MPIAEPLASTTNTQVAFELASICAASRIVVPCLHSSGGEPGTSLTESE
jgi:hypothetical protein